MKPTPFIYLLTCCAIILCTYSQVQAQKKEPSSSKASDITPPQFPGGDAEWRKFIERNIQFDSISCIPHGTITVQLAFTVDTNGAVSAIEMQTNDCKDYGAMLVRLLQKGPRWMPAMKNGRPVLFRHHLSTSACLLPSEE